MNLGGLLNGPVVEGKRFDHGTHMLASTGVAEIDQFLLDDLPLERFNVFAGHEADRAGSFSAGGWNEETPFPDRRDAGVSAAIQAWRQNTPHDETDPGTAEDKLTSLYGPDADTYPREVLESVYGRPASEVGATAVKMLALHRAVFLSEKEIDRYGQLDCLSPIIAHPERKLFERKPPPLTKTIYPKERGLGQVIEWLESKLVRAGVQIVKGASIAKAGDSVHVKSDGHLVEFRNERIIWTAGVLSAARTLLNERFESDPSRLASWIAHVEIAERCVELSNYYYFIRHPGVRTYRLTNYRALTMRDADQGYTLELTLSNAASYEDAKRQVVSDLETLGLIQDPGDIKMLGMTKIPYSFLNATVGFEKWCNQIIGQITRSAELFGPWSSKGLFFTGDCLRDLDKRLSTQRVT